MKNPISYLPILLCLLVLFSCKKEDEKLDEVLFGTWNVTKVTGRYVNNGSPTNTTYTDSNPTGTITFRENGTGEQNYSYTFFGTSYPQTGSFIWEANESNIIIKQNNEDDLLWRREVNEPNKQEATYNIPGQGSTSIDYTLTLEK